MMCAVIRDFETIVVDPLGQATKKDLRALHEAQRLCDARASGSVPDGVCPDAPVAPARGPVQVFDMIAAYPKGEDGFEFKHSGFDGRKTMRCADVFDVMAARAAGHGKPSPFSPSQVAMGRFYRDLVEKHAHAGVKCSSLESLSQRSAGNGSDFIDAVLRDRERLQQLHRRIGDGASLVVRRHRPSARGSRSTITDRRLVDMVCIEGMAMSDVLKAHGWSVRSAFIKDLRKALAAALDRMQGPVRRGRIGAVQFGDGCVPLW